MKYGVFNRLTLLSCIYPSIVTRGISGHLMKNKSVRRRSKFQILEDARIKAAKEEETERRLAQFKQLEAELREMREKVQRTENVHQHV